MLLVPYSTVVLRRKRKIVKYRPQDKPNYAEKKRIRGQKRQTVLSKNGFGESRGPQSGNLIQVVQPLTLYQHAPVVLATSQHNLLKQKKTVMNGGDRRPISISKSYAEKGFEFKSNIDYGIGPHHRLLFRGNLGDASLTAPTRASPWLEPRLVTSNLLPTIMYRRAAPNEAIVLCAHTKHFPTILT